MRALSVEHTLDGQLVERVAVDNPRFIGEAVETILNDSIGGPLTPDFVPIEGFTDDDIWELIHTARSGDATETDWYYLELNCPDLFMPQEGDTPDA